MPRVLFIFDVYVLANDTRAKCSCVCTCVYVWTLWLYPQNPGDKRTLFVRIRHNNYTTPTCTTRCEQHKLVLSLKLITKTFIEFPKFNWSYYLLRYVLQSLFVRFIDQNYTPTVIKQVLSRPTAGTKSKVYQNRPSER